MLTDIKQCTGCSACVFVCPVNCISLRVNEEGFLKRNVDFSQCISCGNCDLVCPIQTRVRGEVARYCVAAITKDERTWFSSSSGGAFTEICRVVFERAKNEEVFIFGVAWRTRDSVQHICINSIEKISLLQKSKYLQSDLSDSFLKAKEKLDAGCWVVFSGTPCQIAGLHNFLAKSYEKLITIDFICHGVGSPMIFSAFLKDYEKKHNCEIESYTFRQKKNRLKNLILYRSLIKMKDGRKIETVEDTYIQLFVNQYCINDCCNEKCFFRNVERSSDFTLADFRGADVILPEEKKRRTMSTLLFNTKKSLSFLSEISQRMRLIPFDVKYVKQFQNAYCGKTIINNKRDLFFADFQSGVSFSRLLLKYPVKLYEHNMLLSLNEFLPDFIIKFLFILKNQFYKLKRVFGRK